MLCCDHALLMFGALNACADMPRTNNAASGGFAGFTFPNAPRAIKDHKNIKKAGGVYPFNPAERPFVLFRNNTVHSTGECRCSLCGWQQQRHPSWRLALHVLLISLLPVRLLLGALCVHLFWGRAVLSN